jgi:hypothetical protein
MYVAEEDAAGRPSAGGYAIAAAFSGDARRISHDWVAAWSAALDGFRAEQITTAARLDAEAKKERDTVNEERLRALGERGKARRHEKAAKGSARGKKETASPEVRPTLPRLLVDPEEFDLRNEDGALVGGETDSAEPRRARAKQPTKPKDPDRNNPKKPVTGGRGAPNYTDEERQAVGIQLVRRVLGADEQEVIDIRHQRNVGADAVDKLRNFYELKVHSGKIPDDISLTRAEYLRANETEDFFLVLVGNVEEGESDPEILIISDPLNQLTMRPSGSVSLSGVRKANALRYAFRRSDEDIASPAQSTPDQDADR